MLNISEYTGILVSVDYIISYVISSILIILYALYCLFQVSWLAYLFQDYRKSNRIATRIESQGVLSPDDVLFVKNLQFNANKDKILIILTLTEGLTFVCYLLGFSFHLIDYVGHNLHWIGLPFNSTCIGNTMKYKIWITEMQYPIVGFLLSLGRAAFLISWGIFDYLLKLITNIYVTRSWQYKHKNVSLICVLIISTFLVVLGTIPHTIVLNHFLGIFVLIVLLRLISRHLSFLSNSAVAWREQDMLYNVRINVILEERIKKRRLIIFSNMHFYGTAIVLILEILVTVESVCELFLYYGKCIFPVLYGFTYQPLISDEQLPQFHLALVIISCLEKISCTLWVVLFLVPPFLFTCMVGINAVNEQRRKRLQTYRFRWNDSSGITEKLI